MIAPVLNSLLTSLAIPLRDVRKRAGLTQSDVAERLHTKQSAIARMERCQQFTSIHRFIDYVMACGLYPVGEHLITLEEARDFTIANPQAELIWPNYIYWLAWRDVIPSQYGPENVLRRILEQ